MSYSRNKHHYPGMQRLRENAEDAEGLKGENAVKAYFLQAVDEALPITYVRRCSGKICIGYHMKVFTSVIVVDMKYRKA